MATIELSDRIVVDGTDHTDACVAWRLERFGRDTPTVTLELKPGVYDPDSVIWSGYANIRVQTEGADVNEFISALDPEDFERMMLEGTSMDESVGSAAIRVLKHLASAVTPH